MAKRCNRLAAVFAAVTAFFAFQGLSATAADGNGENIPLTQGESAGISGLDVPDNPLIRKFRAQYETPEGLQYLAKVMQRSTPYRAFIRSELKRLELPDFLLYLPVIESAYSTTAISKSGATGVWQFMRNSIGGFDIHINEWMDERKDPWITTTAALRKLSDNYRELGDWYLALAAYNCGLGATKTAIKKAGRADYWYLSDKGFLKRETVLYVPKLLAIAEILSRSEEYGIAWGEETPDGAFTTLEVKRPVDLAMLAKECGIEPALIKTVNPALFYNITPPDAFYGLRIPADSAERVQALLDDKSRLLLEFYMYTIKSGDTLYALALHYGVSVDMLLQYNPGTRANTLKIGKKIVIPALREVAAFQGKKDPDTLDFTGTYLVKQGDTLWSIALAYDIQVETLAERNNLDVNALLKLGKELRVPIM